MVRMWTKLLTFLFNTRNSLTNLNKTVLFTPWVQLVIHITSQIIYRSSTIDSKSFVHIPINLTCQNVLLCSLISLHAAIADRYKLHYTHCPVYYTCKLSSPFRRLYIKLISVLPQTIRSPHPTVKKSIQLPWLSSPIIENLSAMPHSFLWHYSCVK